MSNLENLVQRILDEAKEKLILLWKKPIRLKKN